MSGEAQQTAELMWWIALALGVVVALVVAGLLAWIHREAGVILGHVSEIWNVGQRVANNTVHVPLLFATNALAARMLDATQRISRAAASLDENARHSSG